MNETEANSTVISETDDFLIWRSLQDDEFIYHIELGGVSLHLDSEEWDELVTLIKGVE